MVECRRKHHAVSKNILSRKKMVKRNTSEMSQQNKLFHVKNQFYSNITIMTSEKPTIVMYRRTS